MTLIFGLAACSGSDEPSPLDEPSASATASPTPDQAAADQAAVVDLAGRYWAAVVQSENTGNDDPVQFADVAESTVIESQLAQVADYKALGLLRVGEPAITEIEASVTGDTAQILLCKNEDGWTAEVEGQAVEGEEKFGNGPWGATAQKTDGRWLVSKIVTVDEGAKTCP